MNDPWMDFYQTYVLFADRKFKIATTAEHILTKDAMGKSYKVLLLKNLLANWNDLLHEPWMDLYQTYVSFADQKFKMAATAKHILT